MSITDRQKAAYVAVHAADARIKFELEAEGMTLNIGPQHPATHGTLRVVVRLDGEQVVWADPVPGYMHRGDEKLCEVRDYAQVTTLINRIDWLGSFANEVPFILAAEELMGIEAPPRAQWIRTILFEMARMANLTLFLGDMGAQIGAITPVFYAFRDREYVLNLIEAVTGGRFHPNFDRIGGLKDDLPKGWIDETRGVSCAASAGSATRSTTCSPATASSRNGAGGSASSPRTSPSTMACRERTPGRRGSTGTSVATRSPLPWRQLDWKVWTHPDGDSFARFWVRQQEVRESTKMVEQLLDGLPAGPIRAKTPARIRVTAGETWVHTENPLGEMGYYVVSDGSPGGPFRCKIRTPSFSNVSIVPWLLRGVYVPDVITILASLYFILGDIDR